jgi:hypothetical protein
MPHHQQPIEIRSNEMEEIIGQVPHWIVRWGICVLFSVALIGVVIIRYVRYPDILSAKVLVQAKQQPGKVTVRRVDASQEFNLLVKEGQMVTKGDTLLVRNDTKTGTKYPVITPMAGKIYISNGIDDKNTLDYMIWVVPKTSSFDIKINYGNKGAGNVKVGQLVKIDLFDYPNNQFGFLEGRISSILPVQLNEMHQGYVKLAGTRLVTSNQTELPILPTMQGNGEILLTDRSIFERIFGSLL